MIFLGFLYLFLLAALITVTFTLIADIIMMRIMTGLSWRESVRCGFLYFIDRMR